MAIVQYFIPKTLLVKATAIPLAEAEDPGLLLIGEWDYPGYSLIGQAYRDYQGVGVFDYPTYVVAGEVTDGAPYKPPLYLYSEPSVSKFSALPIDGEEFRISQPVAGAWGYPKYCARGTIVYVGVGVGSWDYPSLYSAEGTLQQNGAIVGEWDYPSYDMFGGAIESQGKWNYPSYYVEGSASGGTEGRFDYPTYEFEGSFVKVPDNAVYATLDYPTYFVEAEGVQQINATLVANYWSYSLRGTLETQYGIGEWDYPRYAFDGLAAANGQVVGEWDYPTYSVSGSIDKYGFEGELNYPRYGFDGLVGFPGVAVGIWKYPGYQLNGVIGKPVIEKRRRQLTVTRTW
ncbi:virion-associated protein [Agrobacterium phage Milano]|nr:virion-associated protein [Agrobacterium phage Milano]